MKERKIPLRTCIACRGEKPKREMLRIVRSPEGQIFADFSGKAAGRGAYICRDAACVKKLARAKLLNKTFSAPVPDEVYARIEEEILAGK